MKVHIVKADKESNERCIARFNKAVQSSRKVPQIRGNRYHARSLTKGKIRQSAIMREFYRAKRSKSKFYQ